jgi:hypothetical protein
MYDPKEKALSGIEVMIEKRLGSRLQPKKKAPVEVSVEKMESPEEEGMEHAGGAEEGIEDKVEMAGGDISKLSPEEVDTLKSLYAKMGC